MSTINSSAKYFHSFNLIPNLGPVNFKKIVDFFPSIEKAWYADRKELAKTGLTSSLIDQIELSRQKINPEKEINLVLEKEIKIITLADNHYPKLLKEIYNPPVLLYFKGNFCLRDELSLGVVGARKATFYGQRVALDLVSQLSKAGLTIVSGLAKGIDALAHQAALESGGRTLAVLGSGLNYIYPPQNSRLAQAIIRKGALLSEFPPDRPPHPSQFPQRNRIISGLSLGVLIVEASLKSGSLITAKEALDQNREIFAVPGTIYAENSIGTNNLIKMGAKITTQLSDVLEELNIFKN